VASLAKRLEVRVVDWPRQKQIKGIVALIVVKDAPKRCLNLGATESRVFSPRCSVGQREEDSTSGNAR